MSRQWTRSDLIAQLRSEIVGYFGAASDFDERVAKRFKLNRNDIRCLELLGRRGSMTAGQLSDESGLSTGAVTFLLDRLEEAGMVKRRRDTDDRRRVWVEVVPAAYKRLLHAQQPLIEEMKEVTQRFKAEELAIVRDYMREAKEVFQRQISAAPQRQEQLHGDRAQPRRDQ
ncbi:MAG: MarR family winged helix-turn-helix transcriptional regulator [Acidimicrobiales bacterium]